MGRMTFQAFDHLFRAVFVSIVMVGGLSSCMRPRTSQIMAESKGFDCAEMQNSDLRSRCERVQSLVSLNQAALDEDLMRWGLKDYNDSYFASLPHQYRGHIGIDAAVEKLSDFSVIISGDDHDDDRAMDLHISLLDKLKSSLGSDRLICGLEMNENLNEHIKAFYGKKISEDELITRIGDEVVFPEQNLRRYLRACYVSNIPLVGVDIEQFDGMTLLHRDQQISANIAKQLQLFNGGRKIFVPFGGLHLAGPDRLPTLLAKRGVRSYQFLNLVPAPLHWRCANEIGSEFRMKNYACTVDQSNSYVFPGNSMLERMERHTKDLQKSR
jgi:hypothetical protein